jgi:hypothetical protein
MGSPTHETNTAVQMNVKAYMHPSTLNNCNDLTYNLYMSTAHNSWVIPNPKAFFYSHDREIEGIG